MLGSRSAIISKCGRYRYELRRVWDDSLAPCVVGMLNPSTADAEFDDPTITRCIRRAEMEGYGSLVVWNLGAGRATDPKVWKSMSDPIGPDNHEHIRRVLTECRERNGLAIVGWGSHGSFRSSDMAAVAVARDVGIALYCLGVTTRGDPKHPLYVSYAQRPILWSK